MASIISQKSVRNQSIHFPIPDCNLSEEERSSVFLEWNTPESIYKKKANLMSKLDEWKFFIITM